MEIAKLIFMVGVGGPGRDKFGKGGRNQIKGFFSPVGEFGLYSVDNRSY